MKFLCLNAMATGKLLFVIFLYYIGIVLVVCNHDNKGMEPALRHITEGQAMRTHYAVINSYMKKRENWTTSNMGSWIFKLSRYVRPRTRQFVVYIDNKQLIRREYLHNCSVKNCIFTSNVNKLAKVDAIVIGLFRSKNIPVIENRNPKQIWIFWNDEPPAKNMYLNYKKVKLGQLANIFNWSMTYRSNSDIPVPFGRTVPLEEPVLKNNDVNALAAIIPRWESKRFDILVTTMLSNCLDFKMKFISTLQKYIPVDVIGKCANNETLKNRCPGYSRKHCDAISEYLFYIVMEDSCCREYLTQKIWYNAYANGAIPIVVGTFLSDCNKLLPPNSFIHVPTNYSNDDIDELTKTIIYLSESKDLLLSLHKWRNHFAISNDHWFLGRSSSLICHICEGLNYNDLRTKIYSLDDIKEFLNSKLLCGLREC